MQGQGGQLPPPSQTPLRRTLDSSLSGVLGVDSLNFTIISLPQQLGENFIYFVQNNTGTNFKMFHEHIKKLLNENPTKESPHTEID